MHHHVRVENKPVLCALYPVLYALCSMLYAMCYMLYALEERDAPATTDDPDPDLDPATTRPWPPLSANDEPP